MDDGVHITLYSGVPRLQQGELVRVVGVRTALRAQADSLAHLQGYQGVVTSGDVAQGGPVLTTLVSAIRVVLETGLTVVGGETLYVSAATAGRATNVPPAIQHIVGSVFDATMYSRDHSVICTLADSGAGGGSGAQGAQGSSGSQGAQGSTGGAQGAQGAAGAQGAQGASGGTGVQGANGAQGFQGAAGTTGAQGATGVQGAQGFNGAQGAQGANGAQGATGAQGAQGASGTNGAAGAQGNQGAAGSQGAQGAQGATGVQGAQGAQGFTGTTGTTGAQGAQGATGVTGAQGSTGAQGAQGFTGVQGAQGNTGAQGAQGATGTQGAQGSQGSGASLTLATFAVGYESTPGPLISTGQTYNMKPYSAVFSSVGPIQWRVPVALSDIDTWLQVDTWVDAGAGGNYTVVLLKNGAATAHGHVVSGTGIQQLAGVAVSYAAGDLYGYNVIGAGTVGVRTDFTVFARGIP
jgi:hypothetical protein